MAGRWSPNLEPETLSFPIKPRRHEAFDGWLGRLTDAHRISRAQLFRHLQIDPCLASLDLARGKDGLVPAMHLACDAMVQRLAWAVEVDPERIVAMFLGCEASALLPSTHRRYVCAQCWYEAQRAGGPLIVRREWILRASWRCGMHGLPLIDMRIVPPEAMGQQLWACLARAAMRSRKIQRKIKPTPRALEKNKAVVDYLIEPGDWAGLAPPHQTYRARFVANRYHFTGDRIAMLALAHSTRSKGARQFERIIASKLPETPLPGGGTKTPVRTALRLRTCGLPKPKSEWTSDVFALIAAYGAARQRRDLENELAAVFVRYEELPPAPTTAWPPRKPFDSASRARPWGS